MIRHAMLSDDGRYRYTLTRRWSPGPVVAFVGLNPSTADAYVDDPTIRRCIGFADDWGFGKLVMVNLFAWRATDPQALAHMPDPIGPKNDALLRRVADDVDLVVGAWGAHPLAIDRAAEVEPMLGAYAVLGTTKVGAPRHPLYMKASCVPLDHRTGDPVPTPRAKG